MTKLLVAASFVTLGLAFFNSYRDIGLGFSEDDLPAVASLVVGAVLLRAIGMGFYRYLSRYSSPKKPTIKGRLMAAFHPKLPLAT